MDVVWLGRLVTYFTLKHWAKVKKELMDCGGRFLCHVNASPLREMGKTLCMMVVRLLASIPIVVIGYTFIKEFVSTET